MIVALAASLAFGQIAFADTATEAVLFNRDIRPILSDVCFQCHGPDAKQRKGDLRLDKDEQLFADREGHRVLVPGEPAKSELFRRLIATDDDERMPPPSSGKRLSPQQIEMIRRWIAQGAKWQSHWAFLPPARPKLPAMKNIEWPKNAIDHFVLARLDAEGLNPSAEADRATLLRRLTLDLTGLPPTPDEIEDYLSDAAPDAYEKVTDRLLASPRFGERFARPWLDAARYADTSGYQSDGDRSMWRWRDWVIEAFNDNQPFDEFTIEQLAGDLLPNATLDQVLATGFNRNHRGNAEGGIIPEEYAVEYVVDRVDTTATVWLGLTLGCCRCHDHKFDPFSQREYYQLFAFFNNVPEKGRAIKVGNSPPFVKTPTREQQQESEALVKKYLRTEADLEARKARYPKKLEEVRKRAAEKDWSNWSINRGLTLHLPLDGNLDAKVRDVENPLQGKMVGGDSQFRAGKIKEAAVFDGQRRVNVGDVANIGFFDKFSMTAWIRADSESGTILSRMTDDSNADGYNLCLDRGKLQLNLCKRWLDDALRIETVEPIPMNQWVHVAVIYDGSRSASGVNFYVDGWPVREKILLDELNQSFASKDPFRIGSGGFTPAFRGLIDDLRLFDVALSHEEISVLAASETITEILTQAPKAIGWIGFRPGDDSDTRRLELFSRKLDYAYKTELAHPDILDAYDLLQDLRRRQKELVESFPTTMVMRELHEPKPTTVLIRGAYDRPGEQVTRDVPKALPVAFAKGESVNRLDLARWLVSPDNPLTARVTVNRFWAQLFGQGLVKTVDDFGSQGDWPSHPELLDWLATDFVGKSEIRNSKSETGNLRLSTDHTPLNWDIKRLIRTLVTSAAYRQSSRVTAELIARDPENRLLARGPRARLSAEMVRDQALAASGLLTERLGGPSIKPYQPEGLWDDLQNTEKYVQDHGPSLYRRGLYVFWKRTIAPPVMVTFDAAGREACTVRETRTNTPLQALALLNEVGFVEAARKLAERTLQHGGSDVDARLRFAFRLVLTRNPSDPEMSVLRRGLDRHLEHYQRHPKDAAEVLTTGEAPTDSSFHATELAAWTAISGLILNLDEAVTKE